MNGPTLASALGAASIAEDSHNQLKLLVSDQVYTDIIEGIVYMHVKAEMQRDETTRLKEQAEAAAGRIQRMFRNTKIMLGCCFVSFGCTVWSWFV